MGRSGRRMRKVEGRERRGEERRRGMDESSSRFTAPDGLARKEPLRPVRLPS